MMPGIALVALASCSRVMAVFLAPDGGSADADTRAPDQALEAGAADLVVGDGTAVDAGPSCQDHARNGDETDVDCGGSVCAKCANGKQCNTNNDCQGSLCVGKVCVSFCFANTDWGDDLYGCVGPDRRCFQGSCRTCTGFLQADGLGGKGCWHNASAAGATCTSACSAYGGNAGTCQENDDTACTVCRHWYPTAACVGPGYPYVAGTSFDKVAPFHTQQWADTPGCRHRSSAAVTAEDCDFQHEVHPNVLTRFCVCNY